LVLVATLGRAADGDSYDSATGAFPNDGRSMAIPVATNPAFDDAGRAAELLYSADVTTLDLVTLDTSSAAPTYIGPISSPIVAGLAHDPVTGRLYGTDTVTDDLVWIDPTSGATSIIGNTGLSLMHGVALDSSTGILYTVEDDLGAGTTILYILDKNTGAPTLVGGLGYPHIGALAFDPVSGALYGAYAWSDATGYLVTIDISTGVATYVAATHRLNGLAFDRAGVLYGLTNGAISGGTARLYTVDKTTGAYTLVGNITTNNLLALDFSLDFLFGDGFESGTTSAWSATTP
jgi:hypothetical protein